MYFLRQITAALCEGEKESISEGINFPYKLADVQPKYVLNLGEGEFTSDYIKLDATDSYSIPLPAAYTNTSILSCIIRSTARAKVVVVSPDHGTSTFLIKSCSGTTDGNHFGMIMWQGTVTSITVSVPAAFDAALVDYFLYKIPDLTDPDSWRLGFRALGVVE